METNINFGIVFNRKNKLNAKNEAFIFIRANKNGKSIYFNSNIKINAKDWNDKKNEIRNSNPKYISLNVEVQRFKTELQNFAVDLIAKNKTVDLSKFKELFESKAQNVNLLKFIENEINTDNKLEFSTLVQNRIVLKDLKNFKSEIFFSELNYDLIAGFENYLIDNLKNSINTRAKKLNILKKFVHLAVNKELIEYTRNPFLKFKIEKKETDRLKSFNTNELEQILSFEMPLNHKFRAVFDAFLCAVYSGLRISDLIDLRQNNIKFDIKNGYSIEKEMIKTKHIIQSPISNIYKALQLDTPPENTPENIIKRYTDKTKDLFFDVSLTHSKLINLFKLIGVKYKGFHAARHTLAMYLLNNKQLDLITISKLLGHTDIKSTQIYSKMTFDGVNKRLEMVYNKKETLQTKAV